MTKEQLTTTIYDDDTGLYVTLGELIDPKVRKEIEEMGQDYATVSAS